MRPYLLAALAPLLLLAAGPDPFVGTWKPNRDKSKLEANTLPPPEGTTITYSRSGDTLTVTASMRAPSRAPAWMPSP